MTPDELAQRLRKAGHHVNTILDATDEEGAAATLGCSVRTLQMWRESGDGPECFRTVRQYYPIEGLLRFIEKRNAKPTKSTQTTLAEPDC